MKYVVINVYDRNIIKVGVADTLEEATEIMKNDFINTFLRESYTEEDFKNQVDRFEEWDLRKTSAWLNGNNEYDYDWEIIEVE